jgi:hypothetical protein
MLSLANQNGAFMNGIRYTLTIFVEKILSLANQNGAFMNGIRYTCILFVKKNAIIDNKKLTFTKIDVTH